MPPGGPRSCGDGEAVVALESPDTMIIDRVVAFRFIATRLPLVGADPAAGALLFAASP